MQDAIRNTKTSKHVNWGDFDGIRDYGFETNFENAKQLAREYFSELIEVIAEHVGVKELEFFEIYETGNEALDRWLEDDETGEKGSAIGELIQMQLESLGS